MTDNYVLLTLMIYATSYAFVYIANLIFESYFNFLHRFRNVLRGLFFGLGISVTIFILNSAGLTGYPDGRFTLVMVVASFFGFLPGLALYSMVSIFSILNNYYETTFLMVNLTWHLGLGVLIYLMPLRNTYLHMLANMIGSIVGVYVATILAGVFVEEALSLLSDTNDNVYLLLPMVTIYAGLVSLSVVKDENRRQRIEELDYNSKVLFDLNKSTEHLNRQLIDSENKYKLLLMASDEGVVDYDHTTKIVSLSDKALAIIDHALRGKEMTLWDVMDILVDEDAKLLKETFDRIKYGNQEMIDVRLRIKQLYGDSRHVRLTGAIIRQDGKISRIVGAVKDIHDAVLKEEIIYNLAYRDEATRIYNENAFVKDLNELLANQKQENILFLSIRGYLSYNSIGIAFRNNLRLHFVNMLKRFFYVENCYYLEDGVFAVRNHQEITFEEAKVKYQALSRELEKPKSIGDVSVHLMMHGTYITCPSDSDYPEGIVSRGKAMLSHLESNKIMDLANFKESIYKTQFRANRLDTFILSAIEDDEFYLVYQPQYNEIGHIIGYEALIRWDSDRFGYVSPNEFIPVAERNGNIFFVGRFVIDSTCEFCNRFKDRFGNYPRISINVSFVELINPDYASDLYHTLELYAIPVSSIVLEITETAISDFVDVVLTNIQALSRQGFEIHLDDFGTGYSSLNHLSMLPVDTVKIDKSFIDQIMTNHSTQKIVISVIELCHRLGKKVIAEGIEREDQFNILKDMSCDEFQGYLFSKPLNDYTILENEKITKLY